MTDPLREASDADRAEQARAANEPSDDRLADDAAPAYEADPADRYEQRRDVPGAEDDYDR